jgi:hypothetical protein
VYLHGRSALKLVTESLGALIDTRKAILSEANPRAREMAKNPNGEGEVLMQRFPDKDLPAFRVACDKVFDRVATGLQKAMDEVESRVVLLTKQTEASLTDPDADKVSGSTIANAIREHCKNLTTTPNARFNFVDKAIRSGDHRTCAAILSAPAYLSGLTEDQHAGLRRAAERVFSKACTQRDAAIQVLEKLKNASDLFLKEHGKIVPKARYTKAELPIKDMIERLKMG